MGWPYSISIAEARRGKKAETNLIFHEVVHVTTSRHGNDSSPRTNASRINSVVRSSIFSKTNGEAIFDSYPSYRADEFEAYFKQAIYRMKIDDKGLYLGGWPVEVASAQTFALNQIKVLSKFIEAGDQLEVKTFSNPNLPERPTTVEVTCSNCENYRVVLSVSSIDVGNQSLSQMLHEIFEFRISYIKKQLENLELMKDEIKRKSRGY